MNTEISKEVLDYFTNKESNNNSRLKELIEEMRVLTAKQDEILLVIARNLHHNWRIDVTIKEAMAGGRSLDDGGIQLLQSLRKPKVSIEDFTDELVPLEKKLNELNELFIQYTTNL